MTVRVAHVTTVDLTLRFLLLPQLRRLREEGYEVTGISAPGPWTADLEAEGIRHIPWPNATRSWDPGADARAFASLLAILRRERFDLVHTHNPKPGVLGRVAARAAGVPCVVNTVHGLYATPEDRAARKAPVLAAEWLAARFGDLELYQSEEDLRWARRLGVAPRGRSILLGNGVDLERFDPASVSPDRRAALRSELGIPEGAPVAGTVGRLVAEKGYLELFAAARSVREAEPGVRFVAVGAVDPEKRDTVTEGDIAAAGPHLQILGWREDVRELLAVMDVFVLPTWREGVPRSAIEAAAMERPLVLTDVRGCREVGRHGREALLVPPRDPGALVAAILRLVRDADLRRRMGRAARARALERFDERRVLEVLVRSYERLLRARGLPRPSPGHGSVRVRPARPAEAPALARLHRQALPEAFLPSLGDRFLARMYRALAADEHAVTLVAERDGEVIGFAAGVPSVRGFYRRFVVRHGVPAGLAALPRLVRPAVLRGVLETAAHGRGDRGLPDAELLSIGVASGARRGGVGERLATGILTGLHDRGVPEVKVVVAADNREANRFYRELGFGHRARFALHDGRLSNVWVYGWPSSSPSASASS